MLFPALMKDIDHQIVESYKKHGKEKTERDFTSSMVFLGRGVNARAYKLPSGNIIRVEPDLNTGGWHAWMEKVVIKDTTDMTARVGMYDTFKDPDSGSKMCLSIQERLYTIRTDISAYEGMSDVGYDIARICRASDPMAEWHETAVGNGAKNLKRFFPESEVKPFAKLVSDSGLYLNDCHMGNVMFRKRGERIILTDPVN